MTRKSEPKSLDEVRALLRSLEAESADVAPGAAGKMAAASAGSAGALPAKQPDQSATVTPVVPADGLTRDARAAERPAMQDTAADPTTIAPQKPVAVLAELKPVRPVASARGTTDLPPKDQTIPLIAATVPIAKAANDQVPATSRRAVLDRDDVARGGVPKSVWLAATVAVAGLLAGAAWLVFDAMPGDGQSSSGVRTASRAPATVKVAQPAEAPPASQRTSASTPAVQPYAATTVVGAKGDDSGSSSGPKAGAPSPAPQAVPSTAAPTTVAAPGVTAAIVSGADAETGRGPVTSAIAPEVERAPAGGTRLAQAPSSPAGTPPIVARTTPATTPVEAPPSLTPTPAAPPAPPVASSVPAVQPRLLAPGALTIAAGALQRMPIQVEPPVLASRATIVVAGLPAGTRIAPSIGSAAEVPGAGWSIAAADGPRLELTVPAAAIGRHELAIGLRSHDQQLLSSAQVVLTVVAQQAAPPPMADAGRIDETEVQRLLGEGKRQLAAGHVAAARLLFQRAADNGNGEAARLLGDTWDPAKLYALGVRGVATDIERAIHWYERADELGDALAKARLTALGR